MTYRLTIMELQRVTWSRASKLEQWRTTIRIPCQPGSTLWTVKSTLRYGYVQTARRDFKFTEHISFASVSRGLCCVTLLNDTVLFVPRMAALHVFLHGTLFSEKATADRALSCPTVDVAVVSVRWRRLKSATTNLALLTRKPALSYCIFCKLETRLQRDATFAP